MAQAAPAAALTSQLSNANFALQTPGTMGAGLPVSAPAQSPGFGATGVNTVNGGAPNTNQANLQDFMTNYMNTYNDMQTGILSSAQSATQGLNSALGGLQTQENSFNAGINQGLQGALSNQSTKFGGTLVNAAPKLGTGGLSQNAASLQQLQNDNTDTIKQLQASAASAMAQGDVQFATQISNLQVQQYTLMLNAKEQIYQGLAAEGSSVASLSQAQTSAAAQQEQQLNDMATLATKYGVQVKPGDNMEAIINRVQPVASEQEKLSLGEMRAQINANNAQASLAQAQASVLTPMNKDQIDSLLTWYTDQPVGSPSQQTVGQQIGQILANNPQNAVAYASSYNEFVSGKGFPGLTSPEGQQMAATWIGIAKSQGMSAQDAVNDYVTNNPGVPIAEKTDLANYVYAAYGTQPAVNPWSEVMGKLGASFSNALVQLGQFKAGQALTPYASSVSQMGAYNFNKDNIWSSNTPGANYYVNLLTGNNTTSYNQYVNTLGSKSSK